MTFELMTNGTLAKLPQNVPLEGVTLPAGPFVLLLLPHNRYLLGTAGAGDRSERWVWGRPGSKPQEVFLYNGEELVLSTEGLPAIRLSGGTASRLKGELLAQTPPPGEHLPAVIILRGFMKDHAAFADGVLFQDEAVFARFMEEDEVLLKAYWALRIAMAHGDFDAAARLKLWIKVGPDLFEGLVPRTGVWFSLLDIPSEEDIQEMEALSFSREDLQHMVAQRISPLLLFNPRSGYLILARFGRQGASASRNALPASFLVWAFVPPPIWTELRERRKLPVHEVLLALWGQHDVERALEERSRYAPLVPRG
ncbi:MAG: hypothetical protein K6E38_08860 [Fretibacterium sp.]|nr:hypothetical protein [Fretibacterium sp.]